MYRTYKTEVAGRTLSVDIGRVAEQANGAALVHYGDTVVLVTATASDKPRDGIDFFPLIVYNHIERQPLTSGVCPRLPSIYSAAA